VAPTLVIAGRAAVDTMVGDVPFDHLQDFGSFFTPFLAVTGVGGGLTVRGLRPSEYVGKTKAIANAEVRWRFARVKPCDATPEVRLAGVAFVDTGRVWEGPDPAGLPGLGLHVGAGGGLRIAWGDLVVLRADVGYSEGGARVYADFGHVF
jgi:outer membrane protein assembly factor BamA